MIYAGVNGYLDDLQVSDVRPFEDGLLRLFRDKHKNILETIRTEKEITDKTGEQLKKAVSDYAKSFAA